MFLVRITFWQKKKVNFQSLFHPFSIVALLLSNSSVQTVQEKKYCWPFIKMMKLESEFTFQCTCSYGKLNVINTIIKKRFINISLDIYYNIKIKKILCKTCLLLSDNEQCYNVTCEMIHLFGFLPFQCLRTRGIWQFCEQLRNQYFV